MEGQFPALRKNIIEVGPRVGPTSGVLSFGNSLELQHRRDIVENVAGGGVGSARISVGSSGQSHNDATAPPATATAGLIASGLTERAYGVVKVTLICVSIYGMHIFRRMDGCYRRRSRAGSTPVLEKSSIPRHVQTIGGTMHPTTDAGGACTGNSMHPTTDAPIGLPTLFVSAASPCTTMLHIGQGDASRVVCDHTC